MLLLSAALISLAAAASAQEATQEQIALADAQWIQSGLANTSQGGFFPLQSKAILEVNYVNSSVGPIVNGQTYAREDLQTAPIFSFTIPENSTTEFTGQYTLICADPGSQGDPNPAGAFRHALINNLVVMNSANPGNITIIPGSGRTVGNYVGPAPPPGSGAHRYVWMLFFQQGLTNGTGTNQTQLNSPPGRFNVTDYVDTIQNGVGSVGTQVLQLYAATFFLVDGNGTATGPVITTTPLNTASVSASTSAAMNTPIATMTSMTGVAATTTAAGTAPAAATTTRAAASSSINSVSSFFAASFIAVVGLIALA